MSADVIQVSRRENLPWWGRLILHYLPTVVYRQVLREYDIALTASCRVGRCGDCWSDACFCVCHPEGAA